MTGERLPEEAVQTNRTRPFEEEDAQLEQALECIWEIADKFHLDPFQTEFEVVPAKAMHQLAADALPVRYSHWSYGRAYRQAKTMYDHGLSKIYEMVINSDPAQAFLLENNPVIENKLVMAHVLGHTDFFKHNVTFANTRRDMPDAAAHHAERVRKYEHEIGRLAVEATLDDVLSIEHNIDPYKPNRPQKNEEIKTWRADKIKAAEAAKKRLNRMDTPIRPVDRPKSPLEDRVQIPPKPDADLLGIIRNYAPYLEDWQRDIVDIVRSESEYFYPQMRTKIMNEGWAAYWHKRIMRRMREEDLITDQEDESWQVLHSRIVAPNKQQLNPYYLGMKMYEYLEDYFNGNLSADEQAWLQEQDVKVPPHYDGPFEDSPAIEKLREIMTYNDDQSFIRNYFNKIVADRMNMYIYEDYELFDGSVIKVVSETGWMQIRDHLVNSMVNCGIPLIEVEDTDYSERGELYLVHKFDGRNLDSEYIDKTLPHIYQLWQRPVYLETVNPENGDPVVYMCDEVGVSDADV